MKVVLGIDIGTSGCKTISVNREGRILGSATVEYPVYQPRAGWSEQDPADWWRGAADSIKQVMAKTGNAQIAGVSLSGQMHGMVALDKNNLVVRNAILWNDQRTQAQCDEITQAAGGLEGLLRCTNNMMLTGYTGGKILWLKQNEPENYQKTKVILNPKDYIRYKLTGELMTEVSDASGTGLFDVKNRKWAVELIEKIGLSQELFPKCVESTEQTGTISKEAADLTGVPVGIPVYGGGGDAVISTTGMGLIIPGKVGITLGTSGVVAMGLPNYADNPEGRLQLFCNNSPKTWTAFGCTLAAAGSYQWFRNTFCQHEKETAIRENVDVYELINAQAQQVPPGSEGLIYLPYLTGERCPVFDANAGGVFFGMTSRMGKGYFARAVMEGVSFSLKQVFELIQQAAPFADSTQIIISGGGARSLLWRQILADVFQLPVHTVYGSAEGGAFGAALIAGTGCGLWDNISEAMALAKPESEVLPSPEHFEVYRKQYQKYCKLYPAIKMLF